MNLRANHIEFAYHAERPILRGVSIDVRPGIVTALFGPNGCGKSTLVRCLNGSLKPQSGGVFLGSRPVAEMTAAEIARKVAVIPQETPIDSPFTARQMVMLGRFAHSDLWGRESEGDEAAVEESLARVNAVHLRDRLFGTLSGGERQRVIIARALAQSGDVLLYDEPAAHLDIAHQLELYRLMRRLSGEGKAILIVCHDLLFSPLFADDCVLMKDGCIVAKGCAELALSPERLLHAYGERIEIEWSKSRAVNATLCR